MRLRDCRRHGSIRLGVSTVFLKHEITPRLTHAVIFSGISILLSLVLAAGLSNIALGPLERISRTLDDVTAGEPGADPAGLAFDALAAARSRNIDVLLIDTAGRLQNRSELMGELQKIVRVIKKVDDSAPHAVLLVLDATVGQNALSQVEIFKKDIGVTGLAMTKLDGTARGGILVAIAAKFQMPVHYLGVGEAVDDLAPFSAREFARAIAALPPSSS